MALTDAALATRLDALRTAQTARVLALKLPGSA
jgi:hypothetical protein